MSFMRVLCLDSVFMFACKRCSYLVGREGAASLHNPVIADENLADPTVLFYQGTYYLYATGDWKGFDVYTSKDLVHWVKGPRVLELQIKDVWAPDVFHDPLDGRFHLYYSADVKIGVAVADDPKGPFEDRGILIEDAIDPHLFLDDDGSYYLYYEALDPWNDIRHLSVPTSRIVVQPMAEPLKMAGAPKVLLEPDQEWERGWVRIVEAPWILKDGSVYYLMYSANAAFSSDYAIGYATSESPMGPFRKYPNNPIVAKGNGVIGPGHHSVIQREDGSLWIVYHQKASRVWGWKRFVCIDRLEIDPAGALHVIPTPRRSPGRA